MKGNNVQLIHLAPHASEPELSVWLASLDSDQAYQGILVGLPRHCADWLEEAVQPRAQGARQQLLSWLGLEARGAERDQLERWFQALDWLEEAPPEFVKRLGTWVLQRRARQLAHHLALTYVTPQDLQQDPPMGRWVCPDEDEAGERLLPLLARRWQPGVCKFWLPTPAFFTARPHRIPQARLLLQMDSLCAQELARLRGHELDPEILDTLATCEIEAQVGWLERPHWPCSRILPRWNSPSSILAVSSAGPIQLVTLASQRMWGRPGFLAQAFQKLAELGLSVDLLATSQTSVTLTLDPGQAMSEQQRALLATTLDCQVDLLQECSSIHWVGHKVRQILPQLGPALELFDEHPIYLVSQASSDVSLSLVVQSEQAERLLIPLHALLFGGGQESEIFGPTFQQLESRDSKHESSRAVPAVTWWQTQRERLLELAAQGSTYAYHGDSVMARAQEVLSLKVLDQAFYALKANSHPQVLQCLAQLGLGLECVSPGELERAQATGARRLFTPNFVTPREYQEAYAGDCWVTLDNVQALRDWPEVFRQRQVLLRLDSGTGSGHHKHVRTAGDSSKFGISPEQWPELKKLLQQHRVEVLGLHCHAGSGITDAEHWVRTADFLYQAAEQHFPQAQVLNLGGGLGIPDRPGKQRLDFERLSQSLEAFVELHPGRRLWLEPGRYLVAEAGVLLTRVTQIKVKGEKHYVGVEVGMNSLIRPALYGAYHPIVNLTRWQEPAAWKVDVVGPICESGDVLGHDRWLPATQVGDVLLIDNAGAYGASMASAYNLRKPAAEHWLA